MLKKIIKKIEKDARTTIWTKLAAFLDFRFGIRPKDTFGGAFNGQVKRREMFCDLLDAGNLNAIIETGTFRGSTAEFILSQTDLPVYEIEINPYNYYYSYFRLKKKKNVNFFLGDSLSILRNFKNDPSFPKKRVLFYLDSHWLEHLPLGEEIDLIAGTWADSIIMIDDFKVPDDPGYAFDDYGEDKRLTLEYLKLHNLSGFEVFFPSAHSSEETGLRRGSVVLVTKDSMLDKVRQLKTLRRNK